MYNTLIASAIFLLSFNPYLIMQVGFQLSYLAVIGIVFLQKKIHAWYDAPNWFLGKTWDIISVSIAAQMATFPLGLLYFHQFPNYFLFSNLIIIPLSTIIIYGGICLLLSAPIASLAHIIGLILGELVHFLNDIVLSIEHLPYSLIKGISISVFDTWLIYILILSIVFYLMKKDPRLILASLLIIILLLASQISESIQLRNQRMITIYNIPKKSAITFIENKQCVFLADSDLVNNKA
jgi:competence protein ComEC